ncbi:MAG: GNAT family N-acetyltransferase [Oscillospiraceae bacterium]|nr:GNAT family N-acetyltransferase [Oscillospiraceae bacterium]
MENFEYMVCEAEVGDLSMVCKCAESMYGELMNYNMPFVINPSRLQEILEARIRSKTSVVYVLKNADEISGILVGHIAKFDDRYVPSYGSMVGKITELYLAPKLRSRDIAGALLQKAEEWFRAKDVKYVEADILIGNVLSERFFSKMGFLFLSRVVYKEI